jgi:hypothetical protein
MTKGNTEEERIEEIEKKTLDFLLNHVKSMEDLEIVKNAIEDYEGTIKRVEKNGDEIIQEYNHKVEELKNPFNKRYKSQ